jgi:hypothetical protein
MFIAPVISFITSAIAIIAAIFLIFDGMLLYALALSLIVIVGQKVFFFIAWRFQP